MEQLHLFKTINEQIEQHVTVPQLNNTYQLQVVWFFQKQNGVRKKNNEFNHTHTRHTIKHTENKQKTR